MSVPGAQIQNPNTLFPKGIRHIGCAPIHPVSVARGLLEAYWRVGFRPWDLAVGIMIIEEAGGAVSRIDGGRDPRPEPCSILASNELLHDELLELIDENTTHPEREGKER